MGRKKIKKKAAGDEQICRKTTGKWKCKSERSGEGGGACSGSDLEKQLPPDEERCHQTGGHGIHRYRCKNFKMGLGACADDDTIAKSNYCDKHYNYRAEYYKKRKKKTSRDGEGSGSGPIDEGSGKKKKVTEEENDRSLDHTTHIEGGSVNVGTKRKKKKEMDKKKLPQQYCYMTGGGGWRCKNFRMSYGAAAGDDSVPKTKYCEKHYNLRQKFLQKRRGDGEGAAGPVELRSSKRMKKVTEEDETGQIHPATSDDTSNTIIEGGGSAKLGTKRKTVEQTERSGDPKSLTKIREPVVELESLEHYKNKSFELCVELEKQKVDLEKKNAEFTILQGKYAELESRNTAAKSEDAVEYWRNKCSDLESLVLKMETENSAMRCEVPRVSNLQSPVPRSGNENSNLRCEELSNSEKIESEVQGGQNAITETGGNQREKHNMSTLNAETSSGGRKDSCVYEFKTKEKVLNVHGVRINKCRKLESEFQKYSAMNISSGSLHLASRGENVEEGKGWGCSEGRPFQHGSSSQDFVNLVSDSDDESENPIGDPMDMPATKNCNRNKHEMKWKSEADMLSSFEADPVLCMRAVCVLYRQEISKDEISPKGLVIDSDTLRCTTLAKFLMGEDCNGDLKKSVAELEKLDSKAVGDCKMLVRRYSMYLFDIYENRKDLFFLPATTSSNGDQTAK